MIPSWDFGASLKQRSNKLLSCAKKMQSPLWDLRGSVLFQFLSHKAGLFHCARMLRHLFSLFLISLEHTPLICSRLVCVQQNRNAYCDLWRLLDQNYAPQRKEFQRNLSVDARFDGELHRTSWSMSVQFIKCLQSSHKRSSDELCVFVLEAVVTFYHQTGYSVCKDLTFFFNVKLIVVIATSSEVWQSLREEMHPLHAASSKRTVHQTRSQTRRHHTMIHTVCCQRTGRVREIVLKQVSTREAIFFFSS